MKPGLIETMFWNGAEIEYLPFHFERFYAGIEFFALPFSISPPFLLEKLMLAVQAQNPNQSQKLRMHLYADGRNEALEIEAKPFVRTSKTLKVSLAADLVHCTSQAHGLKTDQRNLYDQAQQQAAQKALDDVLLCNDRGHITETSIMNIFWQEGNRFYTPPVSDGCVSGVLRRVLLLRNDFSEAHCTIKKLRTADAVFAGNALRGLSSVELIY